MRTLMLYGLLLAPGLAAAQALPSRPPFEVMPAAGYGLGGSFETANGADLDLDAAASFALSLRMRPNYEQEWEVFYARQATGVDASSAGGTPALDVEVEYLQFGGTYFPAQHDYSPYVVGCLGVTRFKPDGAGLEDRSKFSLSLGLGMRFPLAEHFALRLEGRGFLTFVDGDTAFFCSSGAAGGACLIEASGSTVWQFLGMLGFAASF